VYSLYDQLAGAYTPPAAYDQRMPANFRTVGPLGVLGTEYSLVEKVAVLARARGPERGDAPTDPVIDFRRDAPRLDVPVYLPEGRHELAARRDLADERYRNLSAPTKRMYTFPDAGHSAAFEEFQPLQQILTHTVLPQTYPAGGASVHQ
jgi:proline iminopeptidase